MNDFDARLRLRLARLEAAVPDGSWQSSGPGFAPPATVPRAARRHSRRRAVALLAAALLLAAVFSAPAQSRGTYESRLRDFGVPAGAEVVAYQADADGSFITVMYRDSSGQVVTLGGIERLHTPPPAP